MALYDFQSAFAKSLSETFGTKIEISSVEALWDSEERISMARRLGGEDAVLAIGKPLEAHRVWPPSPRSKQPIDSGNGKENFATTKAAAATLPQRGVHYLWLSAAAALLPGAAWLFLRSRKKT